MKSYMGALRTAAVLAAATATVAAAAGCSSGGSSSAGGSDNATEMLSASVQNTQTIKSYTAALSVQASGGSVSAGVGNVSMNGTYAEQVKPTPLIQMTTSSTQAGGMNVGSITLVMNSSAVYMKSPEFSSLTGGKSWLEVPLSSAQSGALSSLFDEAQSSNPLTATRLLAGSTDAKTVGTATIDGVSTTEVQGTESPSAALAKVPAALRSQETQAFQQLGITQLKYKAWIDGQHQLRKMILNEIGKTTATTTFTITSINQPVNVTIPSASQVGKLPSGATSTPGL